MAIKLAVGALMLKLRKRRSDARPSSQVEWLARTYWRCLTRVTLGLIRVRGTPRASDPSCWWPGR
jgi:uncharacterized membrane protein